MQAPLPKIFLIIIAAFIFSCNTKDNKKSDAKKQVVTVSILPQRTFVEKIAGNDFKVNVLLPPGASPAAFTLLPSQLKDIAQSELWFRAGYIGFEYSWKEKIEQANMDMKVVDLSEGLSLIASEQQPGGAVPLRGINPHTWMSPPLVKKMALKISEELSALNPGKKAVYDNNYHEFAEELDHIDNIIKRGLEGFQGRKFIMFHPSLAYYAREYGLKEYSLEPGGKQPTPQRMAGLVKMAKEEGISVIYIQSDLDREQARVFAEEIDGEIVQIWPLNPEWGKNLMDITEKLIANFQ